jgi:hypothetical protein
MTFSDCCFDVGDFGAFELPGATAWPVDLYDPPAAVVSSPIVATEPSPGLPQFPLLRARPRRVPVRLLPFVSLGDVDDVVAHLNEHVNP